jgi:hypothetical protein
MGIKSEKGAYPLCEPGFDPRIEEPEAANGADYRGRCLVSVFQLLLSGLAMIERERGCIGVLH